MTGSNSGRTCFQMGPEVGQAGPSWSRWSRRSWWPWWTRGRRGGDWDLMRGDEVAGCGKPAAPATDPADFRGGPARE